MFQQKNTGPGRATLSTVVFVVGVGLAATAGWLLDRNISNRAQEQFQRNVDRVASEVTRRFNHPVNGLNGTKGLYAASNRVERAAFRAYAEARNLPVEFPGVRGFGFIQRVARADLDAFVATERADDAPDFAIQQLEDKDLDDLYIIKLIEPATANVGAAGLDVGSEAKRRAAALHAINTGKPALTAPISLVQADKKTPGVLLYVPVYARGQQPTSPAERQSSLLGLVYAPIVIAELLDNLPEVRTGQVDFELFDTHQNGTHEQLIYDADDHLAHLPQGSDPMLNRGFQAIQTVWLPGRDMRLHVSSTPQFDASVNRSTPWMIFTGGIFASALLALILLQQTSGRRRAEAMAKHMTSEFEAASRDNEALLNTLNLHAIISVADRDGNIIETNDAFCNISGFSRDELMNHNHRLVNSGVHCAAFWEDMWQTISSGRPWRGQVCNRARDGSLYWVDTFIAPFYGDDGQVAKYISIRTDITASKVAEQALLWNQSLLQMMSNSSPLGFLVVDNRDDRILYFNQRFCEIWGIEHLAERMRRGELKNNDIIADCLPVLADVPAFAASCEPLQDEANRITLEDRIAFTHNRTIRRFSTQIRDEEDRYHGRFYIFEDVTELVRATRTAQEASHAKGQFLANMSHEIRTPMNAVLGMLALLRKTGLSDRQGDYAAKAEGAARSLLGLLNEILDYSKIEAGKMTLDPQPFAIDQLLRDLSVILAVNVGQKNVDVLFDIDPALPSQLVGDVMRLQQVLINLCTNAIKFTTAGEVVLSVAVVQQNTANVTLNIGVRDSGIGIAPENQTRIFSGFSQAEASTTRRFGGTGLGVAISQRFVALMGGQIELESSLGHGSFFHFCITLPLAPATKTVPPPAAATATPLRILVIDDNPTACDIMERMGQSLGWQVDVAHSGEQALTRLQSQTEADEHYQTVLVDWHMPGLDGWQTSQRIRELTATGPAPALIMITAHGREMLLQRSESEQTLLDGYLVKPVTASMLFDAVINARSKQAHPHLSNHRHSGTEVIGSRLSGMRLLVAEDNLINQQVALELLENEGAVVQIANNGQEAIDAIASATQPFDVVLMDLQMPVMDGFEATRRIRDTLGLSALPVIAMTANAMASDRDACLAAGMNEHVGKPFNLSHLVQILQKYADG